MSRVLIVEDDGLLRRTLAIVLAAAGFETIMACDGLQALKILEDDNRFDSVLTDLGMPQMDGLTFLKELKTRFPRLPVVVLTANVPPDTAQFLQENAIECLIKPAKRQPLLDTIRQVTVHLL
jgi:CheY-like chemotaxis protein